MAEYDLKRLEVAIQYINRMTSGRNPVTNRPAPENEVLINPNVNRCLQFVGEILRDVKSAGGLVGKAPKKAKEPAPLLSQTFPYEVLREFRYRQDQQISFFLRQVCEPFPEGEAPSIQATLITDWLRDQGYLEKRMIEEIGKEASVPTEKGTALGLYTEKGGMPPNEYYRIFYNAHAQLYIIEHFREILTEGEEIRRRRKQERRASGKTVRRDSRSRGPADRGAFPQEADDAAFSSLLSTLPAEDPYGTPPGKFDRQPSAGTGGAKDSAADFFGEGWETSDDGLPW